MSEIESKKYWIWLSLIKGIGCKRKQKLLQLYESPEVIYKMKENSLLKITGIGETAVKNILDSSIRKDLNRHIQYMEKNSIDIISINDEEYPQILKEIYDPPISLYIKGDKNILNNKSIGIVGCRKASEYGEKSAKYFSYNLANQNFNIVSGLAKGVDTYAHVGSICAIKEDNYALVGRTIAVVGNGLDTIYPQENKELAKMILETGGAIVSEYPLGTKPEKMNFPARNRIISGMSKGIVVIEAKEKSGTLITVDFALEQGRDVFVVPGNINSYHSVGTNRLIQQGAKLITHYSEIF